MVAPGGFEPPSVASSDQIQIRKRSKKEPRNWVIESQKEYHYVIAEIKLSGALFSLLVNTNFDLGMPVNLQTMDVPTIVSIAAFGTFGTLYIVIYRAQRGHTRDRRKRETVNCPEVLFR